MDGLNSQQLADIVFVVFGMGAAIAAWMAAKLWHEASIVQMPEFDPPVASMDDNPSLHILNVTVQLNAAQMALTQSSQLNARGARWASIAAFLTALTVLISIIQGYV